MLSTGLLRAAVFSFSWSSGDSGVRSRFEGTYDSGPAGVSAADRDPDELDLVDVFRRSEDIPAHLDDLLAKRPTAVWFQSGIRNDEVAESLAHAGIKVVQDRCLMVEHRRYADHEKA